MDKEQKSSFMRSRPLLAEHWAHKVIKTFCEAVCSIEYDDCIKTKRNKSDRKRNRANRWR